MVHLHGFKLQIETPPSRRRRVLLGCFLALALALTSGCSLNRVAVKKFGDALSSGGTVFAAENDPELVKAPAPFSLKLMESLLAEVPDHRNLLLATALRRRTRLLYLRGRDYALRGLDVRHPGFTERLRQEPALAVRVLNKTDVPLAYWAAVSWGAAIGIIKDSTDLLAEVPAVECLVDRALELNETYDHGALHTFLITDELVRQRNSGDRIERARAHFKRAVELNHGQQAAPYVSLAENVAVELQDLNEFRTLLNQALAIDGNGKPEWRLANLLMQKRAWS